jgi:hypothetical protein
MSAATRDGDRSADNERVDHLLGLLGEAILIVDELGNWHDVGARLQEVLDVVQQRRK